MSTEETAAADITMTDGQVVHVPDIPLAEFAGVVHLHIPYPADAAPGAITRVLVRAGAQEFRRDMHPAVNVDPGDTLHLKIGPDW